MQATDHAWAQHPPGLAEPSYASLVLTTMASELERVTNRGTLVTEVRTRRAYVVSVAAVTGRRNLPDAVANEVGEKVARQLPPLPDTMTCHQYAQWLREIAEVQR